MKKLTTKDWVDKVKENHDDRYIYDDKCIYTGAHKKITIYCKKHGYFTICADSFMKGANCPKCNHDKRVTDFNEYIKRANKVHNSKYSYNEQDINEGKRKIRIICPIHGEFCQDKFSHLNGQGCPKCRLIKNNNIYCSNLDDLSSEIKYTTEFKNLKKYIETIYDGKIISDKNYIDIPDKDIIFYFIKTYKGNNKNDLLELINKTEKKAIIIYDYEYQEHKDIVNNKISYMLGLSLNKDRVAARKCTIQVVKQSVSKLFLNNNHIQGNTSASIHLGAYYGNKLIAVMLFKRENDNGYNLVRFATDNNLICQGIGGKMFSFFIKNYDYDYIKTFADRRWTNKSNDNLYVKLGFKLDDILEPDYQYYYNGKLIHKFNCRKNRLNKKYNLPLSMTESQMVDKIGMKKVWTCGLLKYLYKKS